MTVAFPDSKMRFPNAETQMETVTKNDDLRGSGRIQVRMNLQADDMNTNWIRVMTPDAGRSGDVKSNRGFVFIPEVGDHVLVGFRHGDPSCPYAMAACSTARLARAVLLPTTRKVLPPEVSRPLLLTIPSTPSSYRQPAPIKSSLMN